MKMNDRPSYYSILTADVRYDKELKANEKLLYSEITALADRYGYCWASNQYFSELYGVSARSVSEWVSHLAEKEYIRVEIDNTDRSNSKRKIFIGYRRKLLEGIEENFHTGIEENFQQIIQEENNTRSNNLKESDGLQSALKEFKEMRKSIKKPLTNNAMNRLIKKLDEMAKSDDEKIAILNQSIDHCWQDIYELKNKPTIKPAITEEEEKEDIKDVIARIESRRNH